VHNGIYQQATTNHDTETQKALEETERRDAGQLAEHGSWSQTFQQLLGLGGPTVPDVQAQQGPAPPRPQGGSVRIQASDGSVHELPQSSLGAAKQRDPGLKVLQ
jgi:hypothetical protein